MGVGEKVSMYIKTVTSRGRNMLLFKSYERWHELTFKIACLLHIAGDVDNAKYLLVKQNLYQMRRTNRIEMVTLFFLPHPVKFMIKDNDGEFSCFVKYDKVRKTFVIVFIGENQEDCVSGRWCASSTNYFTEQASGAIRRVCYACQPEPARQGDPLGKPVSCQGRCTGKVNVIMWSVCEYKHRVRRRPNSIDDIDIDFREPRKYDEYHRFDLNEWKWDVIEPNRCVDEEEDIIMYLCGWAYIVISPIDTDL